MLSFPTGNGGRVGCRPCRRRVEAGVRPGTPVRGGEAQLGPPAPLWFASSISAKHFRRLWQPRCRSHVHRSRWSRATVSKPETLPDSPLRRGTPGATAPQVPPETAKWGRDRIAELEGNFLKLASVELPMHPSKSDLRKCMLAAALLTLVNQEALAGRTDWRALPSRHELL